MIFTEFLDCVKRAGLEGKFKYKEEWFVWNKNKKNIKFIDENNKMHKQTVFNHLYYGFPEPKKGHYPKLTKEEFLRRAYILYNNIDEYDLTEFKNKNTHIKIICSIHGEFNCTPNNYLRGKRCKLCGIETVVNTKRKTTQEFIKEAQEIHKNEDGTPRYDYSKVEYKNNHTEVIIICPIHGEFKVYPTNHLKGYECNKCSIEKLAKLRTSNTKEFIEKAKKIHINENGIPKYDYSLVEYINCDTPVKIICPKHGKFEMTPDKHLRGEGCKFCRQSKLEQKITVHLLKSKIIFERYSKFHWLKFQTSQNLDFYLPDYNIAIECQGEQHFRPVSIYDNEKGFKLTIKRDINKFKLCQENGVKLLYLFPKEKVDFSKVNEQYEIYKPNENIFYSPEELIEYIKTQPKIKNLED